MGIRANSGAYTLIDASVVAAETSAAHEFINLFKSFTVEISAAGNVQFQVTNDPRVRSDPANAVWFNRGTAVTATGIVVFEDTFIHYRAVLTGNTGAVTVRVGI